MVFDAAIDTMASKNSVLGTVLCIENGDNTISWTGARGNIERDAQYFITSVTKLCITALILKLRFEKRINFEDTILNYLSGPLYDRLHVLNGEDYTGEITIAHLLSNTSGIPEYLSQKQANGKTADYNLFRTGQDEPWPVEKVMDAVKKMKPAFRPGQKGKVDYSNTNHRLLGAIIEMITRRPIAEVFQEYIFDELNLKATYAYKDINDEAPVPMYYKGKVLNIPNCMASVTPEGGIVSTAPETMKIIKAFFNGHFFPKEYIDELKKWNFIFFPLQSYFGIGLEKLWVPRLLTPFKPISEILGFWGSSGAFAFYNPDTDLYFTGTVNQSSGFAHGAAFKAILKVIKHTL